MAGWNGCIQKYFLTFRLQQVQNLTAAFFKNEFIILSFKNLININKIDQASKQEIKYMFKKEMTIKFMNMFYFFCN